MVLTKRSCGSVELLHGAGSSGWVAAGSGFGDESAVRLAPAQTYDTVRGGARLILNYDKAAKAFIGTVENTTDDTSIGLGRGTTVQRRGTPSHDIEETGAPTNR